LLGPGLDEAELLDILRKPLQQPEPQFRPGLLAATEHDRDLDLVTCLEKPLDVTLLGSIVVRIDLRPEFDLLDDRVRLVTSRIAGLHRGLVLELSVVHELGHGRPRGRCDLHQVEIGLPGKVECLGDGNDADLFAVRTDESDLGHANALVDTRFGADGSSLGYIACPDRSYPGPLIRKAPHDSHAGPLPDTSAAEADEEDARRTHAGPGTHQPPPLRRARPIRWEMTSAC